MKRTTETKTSSGRFGLNNFNRMAPYIGEVLNDLPAKPTRFHVKGSLDSFANRLRWAMQAKAIHGYAHPKIDGVKFLHYYRSPSDKDIIVSVHPDEVIVGMPSHFMQERLAEHVGEAATNADSESLCEFQQGKNVGWITLTTFVEMLAADQLVNPPRFLVRGVDAKLAESFEKLRENIVFHARPGLGEYEIIVSKL